MNMNMYVYRVTEKQDSESPGEPGELSECPLIASNSPFPALSCSVHLRHTLT